VAPGVPRVQVSLTGKRRLLGTGQYGFGWQEKTGVVIQQYCRSDRGQHAEILAEGY
jgi:hypothetical protein